jgi:Icc protein
LIQATIDVTAQVLQLSDLHLFTDPQARLRGVPPYDCLVDVLQHILDAGVEPQLVVLSGDLAHDERRETYVLLRSLLRRWEDRLVVIPGNHDHREALRQVFSEQFRETACPPPFVTFSRRIDQWLLVGLDSHVPGEVPGRIDAVQLAWLEGVLREQASRPCLLFLHHPPVSVESSWLDELALQEPEQLLAFLRAHPQISLVSAGHVHQEYTGLVQGRPFLTTPSTAMQFAPRQTVPAYDPIPSGYRLFELSGTGWTSRVERLPTLRFLPDREE